MTKEATLKNDNWGWRIGLLIVGNKAARFPPSALWARSTQ